MLRGSDPGLPAAPQYTEFGGARPNIYGSISPGRRNVAHNILNSMTIERVLTDDVALEFNDRNALVIFASPVGATVYVTDVHRESMPYQRYQVLEQLLAQVATPPAVNLQNGHSR